MNSHPITTLILLATISGCCALSPLDYLNLSPLSISNEEYEVVRRKVEESQACNTEFFLSLEESIDNPREVGLKDVLYELKEITKPTDTCTHNLLVHYFGLLNYVFGGPEALLSEPSHDQKLFKCLKDFGRKVFAESASRLLVSDSRSDFMSDAFGSVFGTNLEQLQKINLHDPTTFDARQITNYLKSRERYGEIKSESRLIKYLGDKCPALNAPSKDTINIYNMARLLNPSTVAVSNDLKLLNEYYRICLFYIQPEYRQETISTIKRAVKPSWRNKMHL